MARNNGSFITLVYMVFTFIQIDIVKNVYFRKNTFGIFKEPHKKKEQRKSKVLKIMNKFYFLIKTMNVINATRIILMKMYK